MLETGPHVPVTLVAPDARTIGDMFRRRARASRDKPAIYEKRNGSWQGLSFMQLYERASQAAAGMLALGLEPGDRVAILGPTKTPWAVYDLAAQLAGMVSLGVYPHQPVEQIRYLLHHSGARAVLVDGDEELAHVLAAVEGLDSVTAVIPWSEALYRAFPPAKRLMPPTRLQGEPLPDERVKAIQQELDPDGLAILIYTSGTTGPPKGAMISHRNILSLLGEQRALLELYEDDLSFNFLPMAHAAERVLGFYGRINSGVTTAYASSLGQVLDELGEVQPTLFGSVPRLFEKAYAEIHAQARAAPPAQQRVFEMAVTVARAAAAHRAEGTPMPLGLKLRHALADRLVYRKIRQLFGGRVRQFVIGAAPIGVDILELFWGAGMDVYEVYGLTEATVVTHANRPGSVRLGTVGKPIGVVEQRIADDGEVLVRGPVVFLGYYQDERTTAEAIEGEWLHTGDIGVIDTDGFLRITDRKKHLIITAGGKNLAPANVQKAIKSRDPLISQVHVHGDRRPYVSALVALGPSETLRFGAEHELVSDAAVQACLAELQTEPSRRSVALEQLMARVVAQPELRDRVRKAVRAGNLRLAQVERVRRFVILDRDFSQQHGELTPTMKLKRTSIDQKFASLFDRIYAEDGFALEP